MTTTLVSRVAFFALASAPCLAGNLSIPGVVVSPPGPVAQTVIADGMAALAQYDAAAAADLAAAVASGAVEIGVLKDPSVEGFKGLTDGDTISVRINDGVDTATVGVRLRHEYYHWKYGHPDGPYNGGALNACQHFECWQQTYDHLAHASCLAGNSIHCWQVGNVIQQMQTYYVKCLQSGGNPQYSQNPPTACCY
ncbi:MAG: hypothetical protein IT453_01870 [Planctomycetes bacterium]|nr:hypothetical protein [Planctomycetota bacterium]